jgi:hypothetical protein
MNNCVFRVIINSNVIYLSVVIDDPVFFKDFEDDCVL